jgi:DNA primase
MTIPEIKNQLPILTVLASYGLEPGKSNALKYPFHADGKASMKIYPETNTAYCFAGSCEVKSVDVIDFIMKMDSSTKREAILKAKGMIGTAIVTIPARIEVLPPTLDIQSIYLESRAGMERTPSGKEYCERRALNVEKLGIGYKSRKSKQRWGGGCIIFPLVNELDEVVSLYGRAVKGPGHYYPTGRKGLYPKYPSTETTILVLTESVIDAASLLSIEPTEKGETVLALYGTNGLTAEHRTAISGLKNLNEIILALDGDAAGRKATIDVARELKALRPGIKITTTQIPEGEDLNGLIVSAGVKAKAVIEALITNRVAVQETVETKTETTTPITGLNTQSHYLEYLDLAASYRVRGGIRGGAESLKASLQIRANGQDYRAKVDLYEHKQTVTLAERTAEMLTLRKDQVQDDLRELTELLEAHRENPPPKTAAGSSPSGAEGEKCYPVNAPLCSPF